MRSNQPMYIPAFPTCSAVSPGFSIPAADYESSNESDILPPRKNGGIAYRAERGRDDLHQWDAMEPKERVYHFVYHCDRELRLASVSTIFEQKQNPLI